MLYQLSAKQGLIISFERLFKGTRKALVVFGPVEILKLVSAELQLLEIEEYTGKQVAEKIYLWQVGIKPTNSLSFENFKLNNKLEELQENQQFWWQIVLRPPLASVSTLVDQIFPKTKPIPEKIVFDVVLRAGVVADQDIEREDLKNRLSLLGNQVGLAMLPQAYSQKQLLELYSQRAIPQPILASATGHQGAAPLNFSLVQVVELLN